MTIGIMTTNSHGLASSSQGVNFAYNAQNGHPYHNLGTRVDGYGTIDQMLAASGADYTVELGALVAYDENGNAFDVYDHHAVLRRNSDSTMDPTPIGVVGKGYTVEQNAEAAQFAYDCVGASHGEAIIDTMGVLKNGAEFFAYLRLEPLVLDPQGAADHLEMGLAVRTSHNGSIALCAYPTAVRLVCSNSVVMSMHKAKSNGRIVKVRHTKNKSSYKADAVRALGVADTVRQEFMATATAMMNTPASFDDLRRAHDLLWPMQTAQSPVSQRAITINANRLETLESLWLDNRNSGNYGPTVWAAWQTIGEYLDHHRGTTAEKRAYASITMDSSVSEKKRMAAKVLMNVA